MKEKAALKIRIHNAIWTCHFPELVEMFTKATFAGKEKISKKGNVLLRYAICQATNIAISRNKHIKRLFQEKLKRLGGSKQAKAKLKIKFAEKFIRLAFVLLKNNVSFDIRSFNAPVDDSVLTT